MRGKTAATAVRVALFAAMCLVFMFVLVTVFGQFRFDSRVAYRAVFTNVSGLKGGNFVRIAGVEVGKVKDLTLHKDGTVTVDFAIDKGLTLTEGTKAAVRYEDLIGHRYLSLEDGPGPGFVGAELAPGKPTGGHDGVGALLAGDTARHQVVEHGTVGVVALGIGGPDDVGQR